MKINKSDTNQAVYIIAEVGNNHEGNFQLAQDMIGLAAESGVDAVKFQTFIPQLYVSSADKSRIERLELFKLTFEQFASLADYASQQNVDFISTPFDLESARFLNKIQNTFKISSGDNTFYPLLETVADFGKPIIISTGLSTISEIRKTVDMIQNIWQEKSLDAELALLHCVTSYPVSPENANLSMIHRLTDEFNDITIGYSDHTIGIKAAVHAVSAGAKIIEKHFTIDNNYSSFRDHQLSSDPEEMKQLVHEIRSVEQLMGDPNIEIQPIEEDFLIPVRRSIAAYVDIPKGKSIQEKDLAWVRPGTGYSPGEENKVIGKLSRRLIKQGEIITDEDIA